MTTAQPNPCNSKPIRLHPLTLEQGLHQAVIAPPAHKERRQAQGKKWAAGHRGRRRTTREADSQGSAKYTISDYCPNCETDRSFRRKVTDQQHDVRGETIVLPKVPLWECSVCGQAWEDESFGDPVPAAFDVYRRRHGLLTADQIKAVRERRGLSQAAFAALLGMSQATINRYELGSLQERTHDELIRACDHEPVFRDILARRRSALSPAQVARVRRGIRSKSGTTRTVKAKR